MADYAGAVQAIKDRLAGSFSAAPVALQNEPPPQQPWPPVDGGDSSKLVPWIYLEVLQTETRLRGAGLPGSRPYLTTGHVVAHVFAPKDYGFAESLRIAGLAGEVFRDQTFYAADPGAKLITREPSIMGGDSAADNDDQFGISVSIPFEFYFIA